MNIKLSLFVSQFNNRWSAGAYLQHVDTKEHYFFGEIAANEESVIIAILEAVDNQFEELGSIQILTTTTRLFDFLCKGKSRETAPPSAALRAAMKKMNGIKGTKFKKNEKPEEADVPGLSWADMYSTQIRRLYELKGVESQMTSDRATFTELKRSHKKVPQMFLGAKMFHWCPTEEVEVDGNLLNVYYDGGYTAKDKSGKKNNTVSDFAKKLRSRLYTYYVGGNTKLTDAGQRSLEEIRCVTLLNEKHPIIERFFELQEEGIKNLPVVPVYAANIDKVVGGAASNRLMNGEDEWFTFNKDSGDVTFNGITRTDLSYVFYPQRLGPRIRNEFLQLKSRFIDHLNGSPIGEEIDITDMLYDYSTNAKGKVVCTANKVLNGKFNFIKIPNVEFDGRKFTLKYVFDIDCPPASRLAQLAKVNPRVSLIFENQSNTTIGYYTVVRSDLGISIYQNLEGSRLVRRQ